MMDPLAPTPASPLPGSRRNALIVGGVPLVGGIVLLVVGLRSLRRRPPA